MHTNYFSLIEYKFLFTAKPVQIEMLWNVYSKHVIKKYK